MTLVKFNNRRNALTNYSPFNDLFDSYFKDSYVNDRALSKVPAVNISETEDQYLVELAAPGLRKEDFKLNLEKNVLTVSAELKSGTDEESKKISRKEFSYATFSRSFTLPEAADYGKINAVYADGILNITIGKKEEAKILSREIAVD